MAPAKKTPRKTEIDEAGREVPEATPRYEPPRLLSKRPVERVTLFTGSGEPGGGVGGE
jgi:hypothetical protein